jgi:hypothetical protein
MALQQHAIPQHIASFEFRLVGNLTLKQFGFLAVGMLLAWLTFISPVHPIIKWPISFVIGTGGVTLAFIPVQGRSFDKWLWAFLKAVFAPTQRIWRKGGEHLYFLEIRPQTLPEEGMTVSKAAITRRLLERYLAQVPQGISPLEEEEQKFLKSLDFGISMPAKVAFATGLVAEEEKAKKKPLEVQAPTFAPPPTPPTVPPPISVLPTPTPEEKREFLPGLLERERTIKTPQAVIPLASEVNFVEKEVLTLPSSGLTPTYLTSVGEIRVRKLHSRPNLLGEFLMPVSGEKKFEPSAALRARLGLFEERPQEIVTAPPTVQPLVEPSAGPSLTPTKVAEKKLPPKEIKPTKEQVILFTKKIKKEKITKVEAEAASKTIEREVGPKIPRMTSVPNVLNGLIKDQSGHLVEGAILIVKNEAGIPVRALKTNKLGQFLISTPLPPGQYRIEAEKEGLTFDIIEFEVKGVVIPPIEIYAK